ncbi:MAG: hypothetical protein DRQ88_09135 [Epsilonproteobacteria bacterium]|nr:MAG: hypothetical protein DRQ89_09265 [Campylobacterota bacterium]RLA65496.1 MAG: hypothetical protein DRQ88_09135 [Campylobacterota bacterium]
MIPRSSKRNPNLEEQQIALPLYKDTVVELIKEIALKNPNENALKLENSFLTFEELEKKSDELAQYLIEQGIEPEEKIINIFPPSFELIISTYAILKAGGVYIPLNPKDGNERLKFIIDDLDCRFILGRRTSLLKVAGLTNATLLEIDNKGQKLAAPLFLSGKKSSSKNITPRITPQNVAYIIYTSGTTGRPKGVMVEHCNLFAFIKAMRKTIDTSVGDRWLQNSNVHFDLAVGTMFLSLCNGSTLVLEVGDLPELMKSHKITHYMGTPSTASLIEPELLPHLKVMAVAGEKCPDELIARYAPFKNLYVGYGPAETTILCTLNQSNRWKQQNIGTVFDGSNYYVVKPDGTPAKDGEPGELWIGGDLVARGYLNRPELTRDKFIKNPFGEGRLYKSGDRVRWVKPGFMEFIGRVDRQVKIRGNRIELDGLELLINSFEGVKGTHAKIINDNLVTYIVCKSLNERKLLLFLKKQLPPYAIPNKIVYLDNFPLTRSGKIDSSAFPNPFEAQKKAGIPPQTDYQKQLARLWVTLLHGINEVYLEDNFFDLGGNSLTALRLLNKVRKVYKNPSITVDILYKNPRLLDFDMALDRLLEKDRKKIELDYPHLFISFLKTLPSAIYFVAGYTSIFLTFSVIGFFYPILWIYAFFEAIFFSKKVKSSPAPFAKIVGLKIFEKMRTKSMTVIEDVPLNTGKGNLFCLHPHAVNEIHSFSLASYLMKNNIPIRQLMEKALFNLPFTKTILTLFGFLPSSKESYKIISREGKSLIVTPGGITEYLESHNPSTISLTPNLFFFKIAIINGLDLIPTYAFNVHKSYKFYPELHLIKKKFKINQTFLPFQPFRGRFGLPIPFKADIKIVIGDTIEIKQNKNPSWDEIESIYKRYTIELIRIFEKHKPKDYPTLKII